MTLAPGEGRDRARDGLLPISAFSRATLISTNTLRAYHESGLLEPAVVDPGTGYRGYRRPVDPGANQYFATTGYTEPGTTLMFLKLDEAKTAKNRCHLDLTADDRAAEVKRLIELGATHRSEHGHQWIVLEDPSGNEFCVS